DRTDGRGAGPGTEGHPDYREGPEADSHCDGEGERIAGAGWSASRDSGWRMLGIELQHPIRFTTAGARSCVRIRRWCGDGGRSDERCADPRLCRSEELYLSAWHGAGL